MNPAPAVPLTVPRFDVEANFGPEAELSEDKAFEAFTLLEKFNESEDTKKRTATAAGPIRSYLKRYAAKRAAAGLTLFPKETAKANQKRNQATRDLYLKTPEEILTGNDLKAYQDTAALLPDPEEYRMRSANKAYLDAISPRPIAPDRYDLAREMFARDAMGLEDTSDKALFQAIQGKFQEEEDSHAHLSELAKGAFDQGLLGERLKNGERWNLAKQLPERFRQNARDFLTAQNEKAMETRRRLMPYVAQIATGILRRTGLDIPAHLASKNSTTNTQAMVEILGELPPNDRNTVLFLLSKEMEQLDTKDDQSTVAERTVLNLFRGVRHLKDAVDTAADTIGLWDALDFGDDKAPLTSDERTRLKAALGSLEGIPEILRPSDNLAQQALIMGAGQVANMGSFFAGGGGLTLLGTTMAADSYAGQRFQSPDADQGIQMTTAIASGGIQLGLEYAMTAMGLKLLGGRVPGLANLFGKVGLRNPIARTAIAAPLAVVGASAVEYSEEVAQDAVNNGLSDLANHLSGIDPATDWDAFFKRWFTPGRTMKETLLAIVPFALIGSGAVTSVRHFKHGQFLQQNTPVMKRMGFKSEKIKSIREANPEQAAKLIKEEMNRIEATRQAQAAGQSAGAMTVDANQRAEQERDTEEEAANAIAERIREAARLSKEAGFPILERQRNEFTEEDQFVLTLPGQDEQVFDEEEQAMEAYQDFLVQEQATDEETATQAVNQDLASFLTSEGQLSYGTRTEFTDVAMTPEEAVKRGLATMEQMIARAKIFALHEGPGQTGNVQVMARNYGELTRRGVWKGVVEYYRGADPFNIVEDFAENNFKKGFSLGLIEPEIMLTELRELEETTGNSYIAEDYQFTEADRMPLIEGLSKAATEYFAGNIQNESLPSTILRWFKHILATAGAAFRHARTMARSKDLMKAIEEGRVNQSFVDLIADSVGLNERNTDARYREAEQQAQLQALNSDLEEIGDVLKGRLPHPASMAGDPMASELRVIHDGFVKVSKRTNKKGQKILNSRLADNYFLPRGETASIDGIREEMNERGFDFDTEAEMLEALEDSLFYDLKTYATRSLVDEEPNFSVGWSDSNFWRVIPRDLFNEAKMLSMASKFIRDFNAGKLPAGFDVSFDPTATQVSLSENGELYLNGLDVFFDGEPVTVTSAYNAGKENRFPLNVTAESLDVWETPVYEEETGELDSEFKEAFKGEPSNPQHSANDPSPLESSRDFLNQLGGIGLQFVDYQLGDSFAFDLSDPEAGFLIQNQNGELASANLEASFQGEPIQFFMPTESGKLMFEYQGEISPVYSAPLQFSPAFKKFQADPTFSIAPANNAEQLENSIKESFPSVSKLVIYDRANAIELATIEINPEQRGQGEGGKALSLIKRYSDSKGLPVVLSAQPEPGKKTALDRFYKANGFKKPGRNRDFSLPRHTHIYEPPSASFSISPAQDAEYLAAVESGDMDTAQKMVAEAAKKAGYHTRARHGTADKFDKFSHAEGGKMTDAQSARKAFFFTDDTPTAKSYAIYAAEAGPVKAALRRAEAAERRGDWDGYDAAIIEAENLDTAQASYKRRKNAIILDAYLSGDFLEFDAEGKTPQELHTEDIDAGITAQINQAKAQGKDGVVYRNLDDAVNLANRPSTHYAVFKPSQIKSADPVTYDADGNVVPLSQRFDPSRDEISFSISSKGFIPESLPPRQNADIFDALLDDKMTMEDFEKTRDSEIQAQKDWLATVPQDQPLIWKAKDLPFTISLTPNVTKENGNGWRVTLWDRRGPLSHSERPTRYEAAFEEGYLEQADQFLETIPAFDPTFSLSPAQDAEYLAAVESGDMDTAQEMVDEAAKAAGYDSPKVYRGHDEGQNVFATRLNTPTFTDSEGIADYYAENLLDNKKGKLTAAFLKMENPLRFGEEGAVTKEELISLVGPTLAETIGSGGEWKIDGEPGSYYEAGPEDYAEAYLFADNADFQEWAMNNGHDGFIYEGFFSEEPTPGKALGSYKDGFAKEWRPFNPSQIKSANPVTYDADGNVVPLSQRFDPSRDEISFSISSETVESVTPYAVSLSEQEGNVINTDDYRALIPGYLESDILTRDSEFHETASAIGKNVLSHHLQKPTETGLVLILAGGGGSGKGTAAPKVAVDFTLDTTLANPASARKKLDQIKSTGRVPIVAYIHRTFSKAFQGVIERYLQGKATISPRMVPLSVAAAAHVGAQETFLSLDEETETVIISNDGKLGEAKQISLEELLEDRYLKEDERGLEKESSADGRRFNRQGAEKSSDQRRARLTRRRQEAEARLREEGLKILEDYQKAGKLTAEEVRAFKGDPSFSLSPAGVQRLEDKIIDTLNKGPEERTQYAARLVDRLDGLRRKLAEKGQLTDTERITENVREASAIFTALPIEARTRASFPIKDIIDAKTERGRLTVLENMIDSANKALEFYLKKNYLEQFEKLMDLAKPEVTASKSLRTRLTPEQQRLAKQAFDASIMPPSEVLKGLVATDAAIQKADKELDDLLTKGADQELIDEQQKILDDNALQKEMIEVYGAIAKQASPEIAQAVKHLRDIYTKGRAQRDILDAGRRDKINGLRASILTDIGKADQLTWSKNTATENYKTTLDSFRFSTLSAHQVFEELFPTSDAAREFQKRMRAAELEAGQERIETRERFEAFFRDRWDTGKRGINKTLAQLSTRREWTRETKKGDRPLTIRETKTTKREKLTPEQAADILAGKMKVGWETDPIAMQALRDALADFNMKRLRDQSKAQFVFFERTTSRSAAKPIFMADLEVAYLLQLAAQPQYLPALDRYGFTKKVIQDLKADLAIPANDVLDFLRIEYGNEYGRLNPVFRRLYYMDLPQFTNYAPGKFEHGMFTTEPTPDGSQPGQVNAMSAGFVKNREHHTARPQTVNVLDVFWQHSEAVNYFIAWAELMRDMNAVFKTTEIRRSMESKYGKEISADFYQWLDDLNTDARGGADDPNGQRKYLNNAQATLSAVGLAFNVGSLLKQISAGTGFFMEMPTRDAVTGIYQAIQNPQSFKHLWNNPRIQQRIKMGISPEDRAILDAANAKPSEIMHLLEIGRLPLGWVDGVFTTISSMVVYNYHLNKGKAAGLDDTKAEQFAIEAMDRVLIRTAQPVTTQDKSLIENRAQGLGKFLLIFRSDPRQKFALGLETARLLRQGKITKREAARRYFWGWVMYGVLAQFATNIWHAMSREGEEDDWNLEDYAFAAAAGPLSGLPLFGAIIEGGLRATFNALGADLTIFNNSTNPLDKAAAGILLGRFKRTMTDDKEDSFSDALNAVLRDTRDWSQLIGVANKSAAIVPVALRIIKDTTGIIDNVLPDSQTETDLEIIADLREAAEETQEDQDERTEDLLDELQELTEEERKDRLKELDRDLARSLETKMINRQLTKVERALRRLPTKQRAEAIKRMLKDRSPEQRPQLRKRLENTRIITRTVEKLLN